MKYFISADIEGVAGILDWGETDKIKNDDYDFFRKQMTLEVLAAIEGINAVDKEAYILVKDAHDSGRNLLIDQFPQNVEVIRGWDDGPYSMVQGLDDSFDGVLYIGYHSGSTSHGNPLSHTLSNSRVGHIKVNGKVFSEFELFSIISAHHKVPTLFIAGDEALTETTREMNSFIGTVATKKGIGNSILTKSPKRVLDEIKSTVIEVMNDSDKEKYILINPEVFHVEVTFKIFQQAYRAQYFKGVSIKDNLTVEYTTDDYYEVMRTLMFIL